MDFEKEFFKLLESSKAKRIILDMLADERYKEKEDIERGDMHINEKNIMLKKIKNIKPQNERKVRKLEDELNQYKEQYQRKKVLTEQLQKDIEARNSRINQLKQELEDKCSEYDRLQKNYEEETKELNVTKQQLACYENNFLSAMGKYKLYQSVSESTREGLKNVICEKDEIGFVVSCVNMDNLQRIWEYTKDILSNQNKMKDVEILKEIFDYFFEVYNQSLAEAIYQRDEIAIGDDFDDEYQSRSRESATSGAIKKILLRGYSSINTGKIICKSVVQV